MSNKYHNTFNMSREDFEEDFEKDLRIKVGDEFRTIFLTDEEIKHMTRFDPDSEYTGVIIHFEILNSMRRRGFSYYHIGRLVCDLEDFVVSGVIPEYDDCEEKYQTGMQMSWDRAAAWVKDDKAKERHQTISNRIKAMKNRTDFKPKFKKIHLSPVDTDNDNENDTEKDYYKDMDTVTDNVKVTDTNTDNGSGHAKEKGTDNGKGKELEGERKKEGEKPIDDTISETLIKNCRTLGYDPTKLPKETLGLLQEKTQKELAELLPTLADQYKEIIL